ncbi:MAG: isochorismatase family cysteine hydrolase [Bacillota bacterium]|nr:isochorismatase family cysteine hydrolase [Bacillota bacterium]
MDTKKTAVIVVDMLNDFVTGPLKSERVQKTVEPLKRLLDKAREAGVAVIFSNDSHLKVDRELEIWDEHAMRGTKGAEIIPELGLCPSDYVVPKRCYSGFFGTDMDLLLRDLGIENLVMTGCHTHMCVRHTSADAYQLGYNIFVASDATDSFTEEDYISGLAYLKQLYAAKIYTADELCAMW